MGLLTGPSYRARRGVAEGPLHRSDGFYRSRVVSIRYGPVSTRVTPIVGAGGAVGERLGRFCDPSGEECSTPFRQRVVSLDQDGLRRIRKKVGVVAGADRTAAVLAAVRGGLLNALIIDEGGASGLLGEGR